MQKALRVLICVMFIVGVFGFLPKSSVQAEAYTSYVSGITMVNLSTLQATVTIDYYIGGTGADAGNLATTTTETVNGGAVRDYAAVPVSNFKGAVVISSSQPIAAMSTLTGGGKGRGSYVGSSTGTKTVLLPFLAKNHGASKWSTFIAVQNIGLNDTTVTVDYAGCATGDPTAVVKPGSSVIFDQKTAACLANGLTSAVVTSTTENILAVVDQESTVTNTALVSSGFAAGSTTPVIPLVNANNPTVAGWRTAITIMNVGGSSTDLTLTYQRTDGTTCTETQTIPSQSSKVFAGATLQNGAAFSTCVAGERLVGAAYVANAADNSAGMPLVAIVNQDRSGFASAYGSFDPSSATPRVVMPLIMDNNGSGQWGTSFNVMNVGDAPTFVKCTFKNSTYVATSPEAGLPVNGVFESLQRGNLGGPKVTSSECLAYTDNTYATVDTNAKIVAVVNERALVSSGADGLLTYEAVNAEP
jgi:hypothetical protein